MTPPLSVFLVAGEHSGDQLGFKLIRALRELHSGGLTVRGVGGERMAGEGLQSLFSLEDIAVMGFADVLARLPLLKRRIRETVDAIVADPPDVLVIIDSPDFTHRVAKAARAKLPELPVVDYVSPSVWAWRSHRAMQMRSYVDHVLALLPFEPAAHRRLGGPDCSYVGHPLTERLEEFRPQPGERRAISDSATLLVLPGSRRSVMRRHMPLFGEIVDALNGGRSLEVVIPAVPQLADEIRDRTKSWTLSPRVVVGEQEKLASMRRANVALAVSGTSTLELAVSGVPMVGAYRLEPLANIIRRFVTIQAEHVLLPNLVLEERAIPEFVAEGATAEAILPALRPLMHDSPVRQAQEAAFQRLEAKMHVPEPPSTLAARIVSDVAKRARP